MVSVPQEREGSEQWEGSQGWMARALAKEKPSWAGCTEQMEALCRGEGEPGTEATRNAACHCVPGTAQSRATTECRLCPGWLSLPTFVPNADGTVAAGEGLVLAGEPNRHVPGLRRRESKAQRTRRSAYRAREGLLSPGAWDPHSLHTTGRLSA